MKLRNKKTGAIVEAYKEEPIDLFFYLGTDGEGDELDRKTYHSLAELNAEWEDAEDINVPNIPLIKDEKIRELVRAWAQINKLEEVEVRPPEEDCAIMSFTFSYGILEIDFFLDRSDISGGTYSIAELCGEEEE